MHYQDTPYTTVIRSPNDNRTQQANKEFHIVPCPQCPPMHTQGTTFIRYQGRYHVKGCPQLAQQESEKS